MHLGDAATRRWLTDVADLVPQPDEVDIAVLPNFTAICAAKMILAGSAVRHGAQDCFWLDSGAYTGEVSPGVLRELGCHYVEVGHAERRRLFHEDDDAVARKAAAASRHGLVPIVCVGENVRGTASDAGAACVAQLDPVLAALVGGRKAREIIVAYEPVWAIGAAEPAPAEHIDEVVSAIRSWLDRDCHRSRIIYGGSAGPGLFQRLHGLDGLFLGRSALDVRAFAATVKEVAFQEEW
jgi:triosephosphate isomerase